MMMFDLLFKESDKIIKHDFDGVKSVSTFAFTRKTKSLKSIFSIKNVTEFLISYVDEVTPEFLVAATKIGNIDAVKAIVKRNSSYDFLNQVFHPSGNALSIACNNESNEIAKFLLNSCPEIDPSVGFPKNGQYLTPLIISVSKQNFELIRAIIALQKANKKNEKISLNRDDNDNSDEVIRHKKSISKAQKESNKDYDESENNDEIEYTTETNENEYDDANEKDNNNNNANDDDSNYDDNPAFNKPISEMSLLEKVAMVLRKNGYEIDPFNMQQCVLNTIDSLCAEVEQMNSAVPSEQSSQT